MMDIKNAEAGTIGLIQLQQDGSIVQIGLTEENSRMLNIFLASISQDQPLPILPSQYNLILRPSVEKK